MNFLESSGVFVSKLGFIVEVDPEDVVLLVISEYMKAEHMLEYTKEEFFRGMQKLR